MRLGYLLVGLLSSVATMISFAQTQPTYTSTLPDSILSQGEPLQWLGKIKRYCEGPTYDPADGMVYWTEQISNMADWPIWRLDTKTQGAQATVWAARPGQANGTEFDPQGRLVAALDKRIGRFKKDGTLDSVLTKAGADGVNFNQANDLTFLKDGSLYFTDLAKDVFYLNAQRKLVLAATGFSSANGIQVIEEENAVYIDDDSQMKKCLRNADGTLQAPTAALKSSTQNADGNDIDSHGNWYIANYAAGEFRVFNHGGEPLGAIALKPANGYDASSGIAGNVSNCTFGGPDGKTLFMTGDGGLYALKLKIPGRTRPYTGNVSRLRSNAGQGRTFITSKRQHGTVWFPLRQPNGGIHLLGRKASLSKPIFSIPLQ